MMICAQNQVAIEETLMLLAAGYFDESTDGVFEDRVFSVGGYIASGAFALQLEFGWKDLLAKYDLEYFKASELESGIGQFAKFRDKPATASTDAFTEREKTLLKDIKIDFVDLLCKQKELIGISATVNMRQLKTFAFDHPELAKRLPSPVYNLCSQLVLMEAGVLMNDTNRGNTREYQAMLKPIFDSHREYEMRFMSSFPAFKFKNPASCVSLLAPAFEDERKYLCLQAADLFIYEIRKSVSNMFFEPRIKIRQAMKRLFPQSMSNYILDYAALKLIAETNDPDSILIDKI